MISVRIRTFQTILAGVALCAPYTVAARDAVTVQAINAKSDGVERVVVAVEGGAALFSLYLSGIDLAIASEERDDFLLEASDERGAGGMPVICPRFTKEGNTLTAIIDFGGFRLMRVGRSAIRVKLLVPASFHGELKASLSEGTLSILDLGLINLSAFINRGRLNLERVNASDIVIRRETRALRSKALAPIRVR